MSDAEFWATFALLGIAGNSSCCWSRQDLQNGRVAVQSTETCCASATSANVSKVNAMDLILVPVWFVVEITALVVGLVIMILLAWAA
jgi:hypothetical protein